MSLFSEITVDRSIVLPPPLWYWEEDSFLSSGPDVPANVLDWHARTYQTKDLGEYMERFRLGPLNALYLRAADHKWIDGDPTGDWIAQQGYSEEVPGTEKWLIQEQVVARITFYDWLQDLTHELDGWIEYEAVIVDGKLHKPVSLVSSWARPSQERKDAHEAWKKRLLNEQKYELQ